MGQFRRVPGISIPVRFVFFRDSKDRNNLIIHPHFSSISTPFSNPMVPADRWPIDAKSFVKI